MNIVDAILFRCRRQPPAAAICVPGQKHGLISYGRLERSIHNATRRLLSSGVVPGSVVAVNIQDAIIHVTMLLALTRLGIATLNIQDDIPPLPFKADLLLTDTNSPASAADRVALVDLSWIEGDGAPVERRRIPSTFDGDIFRLVLDKAGAPKVVGISQGLLAERIARHLTVFGNALPRHERFYSHIPIATALGFEFLIYSLLRGGMIVFPGDRLETTLQVVEEHKVACLIAPPDGLDMFATGFEALPAYQSNIELVVCAGMLPPALMSRVRLRVCSHLMLAYGSAEAGITAVAYAHEIADIPGAAGFVTPATTVEIVDRTGIVLPAGHEGVIRIKSSDGIDGYVGSPEETARSFRGGWFYPGSTGKLMDDDLLVVTG